MAVYVSPELVADLGGKEVKSGQDSVLEHQPQC